MREIPDAHLLILGNGPYEAISMSSLVVLAFPTR